MDIDRLKEIVEIVSGALDTSGQFTLTTSKLESPALKDISDDFLPDNKLRLSSARVVQELDGIRVRGTGNDLPFKGMAVEVRFYLEGGTAAFSLIATGDADWTLAKGFPPFAGTLAEQLRFDNVPKLFLNTHAHDGRPRGLYFEGTLDLKKMTGGLASLTGGELSGPIVLKEKGSKLHGVDLTTPSSKSIDLGIATVEELTFKVRSELDSYSKKTYITPFIELMAAIPFTTSKQGRVQIPISARATRLDSGFRFQADLSKAIDAGINELASLTKDHGMSDLLPSKPELSSDLKLNEFFFDFDPPTKKVTFIGMGVQSTKPWRLLHVGETNQDLTVRDVQLSFVVGNPFGEAYKSLTISGEFDIGNAATIVASMRYPDWVVHASLKDGSKLKLQDAVAVFKSSTDHVPKMEVDQFALVISQQDFSLGLALEGELQIPDTPFGLDYASVSIEKTASGSTFSFSGILVIGGVNAMLTANYPGQNKGWSFEGSTGPDQQVPIGNLIEDLAERLGPIKLPSAVASLVVENLSVTFETESKHFTFGCDGKFRADQTDVDITVLLDVKPDVKQFGGTLKAGGLDFGLHFVKDGTSDCLVATYRPRTAGKSLNVKQLVESVSTTMSNYVPAGLEIELKNVIFAYSKGTQDGGQAATSKFLFGMDIGTGINLSNLPLVGQQLPPNATVGVDDLQILFNSKGLTAPEVEKFNDLIPEGITRLPIPKPAGDHDALAAAPIVIEKGFSISAVFNFGGLKQVLSLPGGDSRVLIGSDVMVQTKGVATLAAPATDNVKWFAVQKSFGPVFFDKVGVQYQASTLRFLLNAALSAAGLTLSLEGASFGSSLTRFKPEFDLRGLGIEYKNDAVEIGGAFLRTKPDTYDGAAVIKTKKLALSALGSYAEVEHQHSLFIYAFMDYPLGGPAFFFVTGLAAGFGYNRRLIAPSIENVAEFPLVKQAAGREATPKKVLDALSTLQAHVPPAVGEIFLAVGVKFNSFKLIDSFALLTFEFGSRFVVNLLGLSTAIVPPEAGKNVTPLAQVQIAWKASFDPDDGRLAVDARLTPNSYILSKDCRLSGGYAFYSWFSGDHAGDFVQTLGGYDRTFETTLPSHYPKVPRLAFNWRVSNSLTIQGDAYYALTGSALMAGGHLEVLFKEGELRAWLKLGAEFLIAWKPYHYETKLHVSVGASYTFDLDLLFTEVRITISVDVGADLHLWGPDFSGTAHIDISVISFTIAFGAGASQEAKKIEQWSIFEKSFLPVAKVCSISVQDGLVRKMEEGQKEHWIINPKELSLLVNSAIPFKSAASGKVAELVPAGATVDFGIAPMAVAAGDLTSKLTITIKRGDDDAGDDFKCEVIQKRVPLGLWGETLAPQLDQKSFLEKVPSAIEITPVSRLNPSETAIIKLDVFEYSPRDYDNAYVWEREGEFARSDVDDAEARKKTIRTGIVSNPFRSSLLEKMGVTIDVTIRADVVDDFMSVPQTGKFKDSTPV